MKWMNKGHEFDSMYSEIQKKKGIIFTEQGIMERILFR